VYFAADAHASSSPSCGQRNPLANKSSNIKLSKEKRKREQK